MKKSSKGMSEMLGRMQWRHLANVKNEWKNALGKSEMLGRMQWNI